MKKILLFFIFTQTVLSQSIVVNTTTYTVPQLVTSVLFGAGTGGNVCSGTISNITWDTGTNHSSTNGIGYFTNTNANFPLQSGVILSSGNVAVAAGPNTTTQSNGAFGWPGDTELFNYIDALGIDTGLSSYNNATKLEFDFVPLTNQMSFDFLFASEEYGTYQCDYSDAFAFFLTNVTAATPTINLALIPSTNTPISVTTIRDTQFNTSCGSANVSYFGSYTDPSLPSAATAPTNFNGLTKKMTAATAVIPNNTYHIKLVVADRNDSAMDSAVFLGGGSFNIGSAAITGSGTYDGVTAFTVANGQAICNGGTRIIKAGSNQIAGTTYSWSFNGNPIAGANGYTYTVTQAGTYSATITYSTGCSQTSSITVEYLPAIPAGTPSDLYQPITNPIFNLTTNTTPTLNGLNSSDYDVNYHLTLAGAENIDSSIPNPNAFVGTDGQIIYTSVNDFTNGCVATRSFVLHLTSTVIIPGTPPALTLCDDASNDGLATFDFTNQTAFALGANNPANFSVSYHLTNADATAGTAAINPITSVIGANGQMIYVRVQENANPTVNFATTSFQLFVNPTPPAPTLSITQPICTVPTGTITVNSPLSGSPLPNDLFISEVTDEDVGSLTYIEIYNGTGSAKNLSNYKIKVYNNGSSSASCDLPLSGTLANNATFVLSVGSATNVGGVTPNQVNSGCGGVNDNDNIRLTSSSNVEIDLWGRTDGTSFTPNNQPGYTYRRLATSNPPSTTWNPANWLAFDYQTYSNVGSYSTSNFQYSLDGGSYQASTTFSGVPTGTHTVTVKDMITGCISNGTNAVINAVPPFITPSFVAAPAVCLGSNLSAYLATSSTNGITGTWSPLPNNTSTTNYTFTPNAGQCANNTSMTITINPLPTATILGTTAVCVNAAAPTVTFTGASSTAPYTFTYNVNGGTNQTVTS
ncbi:choice-of-anchor L domain-containing protein, partial [Flavobacterium sp. SUN046]|uniref:choice-of-anchor L domain-containing protein n=1 Tax=Flavobacterium sp. SUN046 TaxID=3002440 RepID=UPI002DBBA588